MPCPAQPGANTKTVLSPPLRWPNTCPRLMAASVRLVSTLTPCPFQLPNITHNTVSVYGSGSSPPKPSGFGCPLVLPILRSFLIEGKPNKLFKKFPIVLDWGKYYVGTKDPTSAAMSATHHKSDDCPHPSRPYFSSHVGHPPHAGSAGL
jgi:hypothetical protein